VSSQYVILSKSDAPASSSSNGMPPIGSRREIIRSLSGYNTAPESSDDDTTLYGPGIRLELPPGQDPVTQMLLTVVEEEIAWLVILRLAKAFAWKIVDMNTGRELNA
jgi:hypothetical protein